MSTIFTRPSDALDVLFDAARPGPVQEPHGGPFSADGPFGVSSLVSESGLVAVSALSQPSEDVLDLWDKCRFVRQGWFTGQEAVTYLDLYVLPSLSFIGEPTNCVGCIAISHPLPPYSQTTTAITATTSASSPKSPCSAARC
jgi:hypothetical protein